FSISPPPPPPATPLFPYTTLFRSDLFPTLARLLGAAPPRGLPGHDLLAARAEAPAISETLYGLMPDGATTPIVSLRTAGWKLIQDRKSTRLNSSHVSISYAVFCLK